ERVLDDFKAASLKVFENNVGHEPRDLRALPLQNTKFLCAECQRDSPDTTEPIWQNKPPRVSRDPPMFDPYHKWLAIPKNQRPPTFYQLLGIAGDETDREVIEEAAIRQTTHLRTYQTGPHAKECTALLSEVAQARATLLNPGKRQEYDARLKMA